MDPDSLPLLSFGFDDPTFWAVVGVAFIFVEFVMSVGAGIFLGLSVAALSTSIFVAIQPGETGAALVTFLVVSVLSVIAARLLRGPA